MLTDSAEVVGDNIRFVEERSAFETYTESLL
jgi:hypothetical protein